MAQFKLNDKANLVLDGTEIEVKIVGSSGTGLIHVQGTRHGERVQDTVEPIQLLRR
jgi:hypothetical protein